MKPEYVTRVHERAAPLTDPLMWTFYVERDGALVLAGMAATEVEAREAGAMLVAMLQIKRGD